MAQNEATEPEWDLAKIPCYCEVICLCKLLTSNTPSNRGRKFLKCANEVLFCCCLDHFLDFCHIGSVSVSAVSDRYRSIL
ncbi:hypothetical protein M6B38_404640 [Iris pallida]|uniref:Uncharacterized protein n=1 Tax=Iris pallida TaxID=29817 RepID=A0AAX6E6I5_IRIPA|nr:hypothetical protein M6B38_112660 [Iris pallida]KAJ6799702.1 hypothetical protein M6B38_205950 [Iris pallida]KAJ6800962.1 hypothetical protein M6B38_200500 [Iris pallida]KAJ6810786.1 hypothetical protein M6B38_104655 [Iris pallida]KAJ6818876.1 hypothetical protein M6B38_404640 [Iris pallida]